MLIKKKAFLIAEQKGQVVANGQGNEFSVIGDIQT